MIIVTALLKLTIAFGVFACAAYIGVELSRTLSRYLVRPDGKRQNQEPHLAWLLVGNGLFGAALAARGMDWQALAMAAIISVSLVGCWHSATTYGQMPDLLTLVPTGAILLSAVALQNWPLLLGIAVAFLPFASMAYLSKGKGMGWDDAKLAGLGGAILGLQVAILAYATACVVAVTVTWIRKKTAEPIAFGPYVIGAIAIALLVNFS